MSAVREHIEVDSVLLGAEALVDAHRRASDGGRRALEGLYHAGQRVQAAPAQLMRDEAAVSTEEQSFGRIAQVYETHQKRREKKCQRLKKTEEELADDESSKKARAILDQSTENEKRQFISLFDFFDVDKDRTWGSIEFAQRMTEVGCNTSVESAANLLYFAGVRNVDRITYDDFIQMMPKLRAFRIVLEKDAMRAFAARDIEGKGFLSRHALRDVLRTLAGPDGLEDDQVHSIVKRADRERTGRIFFAAFIRALFGTPPMVVYVPKPKKPSLLARLFGCGTIGLAAEEEEEDEFQLGETPF